MKILPNIPALFKLLKDVRHFNKYKKYIDSARADGDYELEKMLILECTSSFGDMLIKQFHCDFHVHGQENIPDHGPVVVVGNHQGYADIPMMFAAFNKFQLGFIAKQPLAKLPLYGEWIPRIRGIFIDNTDARASLRSIKEGVEYLNLGFSMAIFPEGTRSHGPEMGEFMPGSLKLATKAGVPIIPFSLNGTYRMYEETGVMRGARIDVMVHEPIQTAGLTKAEERALSGKIEQIIKDGVAELVKLQPDYVEPEAEAEEGDTSVAG